MVGLMVETVRLKMIVSRLSVPKLSITIVRESVAMSDKLVSVAAGRLLSGATLGNRLIR